jgi:hypothetical protein
MNKTKASEKIKQKINKDKRLKVAANSWDKAIVDAEISLACVEDRAIQLRRAIRSFKDMRDAGEPWPGTGGAAGGAKATTSERGS